MKKCFAAILAASALCSGGAALADVMPDGMSDEMPDGMSDDMSPGISEEMSMDDTNMDDQMDMDMEIYIDEDMYMEMDDQMPDVPVAENLDIKTNEDTPVSITPASNDTDENLYPLSVTEVSKPSNGSAVLDTSTSIITYTPAADYHGTDSFTYTVSDGIETATGTINITVSSVNDVPVANDDPTITTNEDTPVTITPASNDTDADKEDTLSVTEVSQPSNGRTVLDSDGITITYTPNNNYHGTDSFQYTVSDGKGGTATGTVKLEVSSVNDVPVANDDPTITTNEDTPVIITPASNDTDADREDTLSVTEVGQPSNGRTVLDSDGITITYTPNDNYHGTDSFQYTVSDGKGGTATGTVKLEVSSVNDVPVANDDTITTNEDTPVIITPASNDTDADKEDTLSVTEVSQPRNGRTVLDSDGITITYTPNDNYHGTDSFEYTVSDGKGGIATGTVKLEVSSVNDVPVANDDPTITTNEDTPVTITPASNDTDADKEDTLSVTEVSQPSNGRTVLDSDGITITYTPNNNYHGTDSFEYTVADKNGGTATGTVKLEVSSVNDDPVAVDDTITTKEDTPVTITPASNDTDADKEDTLSVTVKTPASNGSTVLDSDAGTITYTPDANYHGTDSFEYTVADKNGGTATGTVDITVSSVNDDPVAKDDTITTKEYTPVTITPASNDTDADKEDTLSVTEVSQPSNGRTVLDSDGITITYTPKGNYHGPDSFEYTVADGKGGTATGTVNITVSPDMRCSLGFATGATFPTNKLKGDNKVGDREIGSGESTLDTALTFDTSVQCPIIADGRGSLGLILTRFTSSFDEIKVDDKENDRKFTASVTGDQDLDVSATSLILDYTHSFDMFSRWTPYVGTGVGITWSFVEEQEFSNSNIDEPFHAIVNENTNSSFSWRIKAGTEYAINDAWGLYGEVRYGQSSGFTSKDGITYEDDTKADVDYESFGGISTVAGIRIRF